MNTVPLTRSVLPPRKPPIHAHPRFGTALLSIALCCWLFAMCALIPLILDDVHEAQQERLTLVLVQMGDPALAYPTAPPELPWSPRDLTPPIIACPDQPGTRVGDLPK